MLEGPEYVGRFSRLDDQDPFTLVIHLLLDGGARRHEGVVVGRQWMPQTKQPEAEKRSPGQAKDTAVSAIDIGVSRRKRDGAQFHPVVFLFSGPEDAQDIKLLFTQTIDTPSFYRFERGHLNAGYFLKILNRPRIGAAQNRDLRVGIDIARQDRFGGCPDPLRGRGFHQQYARHARLLST